MFSLDDCLYLYYVCTDKLGTWPENKQKCFQTFENCQSSIGNGDFGDIDLLSTTNRPTSPTEPVITSTPFTTTTTPQTTTTTTAPTTFTTQEPITTTTEVNLLV